MSRHISPGLARNASISSGMLFTDSWLLTVSIKTIAVVAEIGTRSRLTSYGSFSTSIGATVIEPATVYNSV